MSATTRRLLRRLGLLDPLRDLKLRLTYPQQLEERRRFELFYSQFIRPGDLCFDVGANKGARAEIFLRLGARVVAVEPLPKCIAMMESAFAGCRGLHLVQAAAGSAPGEARIMVGEASFTSTINQEWASAVSESGRFSHQWHESIAVPVTTLDQLIKQFGSPVFCKVDVEGYELEVLRGLSELPQALSFEFTPEVIEIAVGCLERLSGQGSVRCNYSLGESALFQLDEWVDAGRMIDVLRGINDPDHRIFGDVYVRRQNKPFGSAARLSTVRQ